MREREREREREKSRQARATETERGGAVAVVWCGGAVVVKENWRRSSQFTVVSRQVEERTRGRGSTVVENIKIQGACEMGNEIG